MIGLADTILNTGGNLSYDDMERLTAASFPNLGKNLSWTYDRYGNSTSQTNNQGSSTLLGIDAGTNRISGGQYSAAGNLLSDGVHSYTYDEEVILPR